MFKDCDDDGDVQMYIFWTLLFPAHIIKNDSMKRGRSLLSMILTLIIIGMCANKKIRPFDEPGHREIMSREQTPVFHQPQILSVSVESIQPPFWLATTCISLRLLLGSANFEAKPPTRRRACAVRAFAAPVHATDVGQPV